MGKTVLESKFTEWAGLDRISTIVHQMKCIWREITKDDFGLDGEIEVVVPKQSGKGFETLGNIIKVQAKSGLSYVKEDSETAFSTPVAKSDLEMWSVANYPVLFVVYHPDDDKLYCKEIRGYVRNTSNVFKPPFKILFNKVSDEFNKDYFTEVRRFVDQSQPRVSYSSREQIFSNLLPVRRVPHLYHATTDYSDAGEIRKQLQAGDWPPFCIVDGRLFTLGDLRQDNSPLKTFCDTDIERLPAEEWIESDPKRQGDYTYLLNQLLGKMRYRCRLKFNKDYERTYFPRENDTDLEFKRTWYNVRSHRNAPERIVCKYYEYGAYKFWRHLACNLGFFRISDSWFLRISPRYLFTSDGLAPWDAAVVGEYTTQIKAREHNQQVLNHVLFWADTLAQGKDSIAAWVQDQIVLKVDRLPMAGIAPFAIVDDPAVYEEVVPAPALDLFSHLRLETDDD